MSDLLASDSPVVDPAAPAPGEPAAVPGTSVDSTDVITKERFNGLQSKYQSEKMAWDAERAAFLNQVASFNQTPEEPQVSDDVLDEVRALRAELANQRSANARQAAINKYPGAAPFADLIVGDSPEAIEAMAALLQERLAGLAPTGTTDPPSAGTDENLGAPPVVDVTPPVAPTFSGATGGVEDAGADDAITAALEARDFSAFLAASARRAELQQDADLQVG